VLELGVPLSSFLEEALYTFLNEWMNFWEASVAFKQACYFYFYLMHGTNTPGMRNDYFALKLFCNMPDITSVTYMLFMTFLVCSFYHNALLELHLMKLKRKKKRKPKKMTRSSWSWRKEPIRFMEPWRMKLKRSLNLSKKSLKYDHWSFYNDCQI